MLLTSIALTACGTGPYDVSNSTDRAAMKVQIKLDLTNNDCTGALTIATQLYQSSYSDNETRMLYASAHACDVGIQLFQLLDDITNASFTSPDSIIRVFVKLFPSTSADSRMQSSWFAQDALQSILNLGAVIAPADVISGDAHNPASDLVTDRTLDSGSYLMFTSMAVIGTTLNRYGYTSSQSPAALAYSQGQDLSWTSQSAVATDSTGAACALASGFFNLFDGIDYVVTYLSGSTSSQLQLITSTLQTGLALAGTLKCTAGFARLCCEYSSVCSGGAENSLPRCLYRKQCECVFCGRDHRWDQ